MVGSPAVRFGALSEDVLVGSGDVMSFRFWISFHLPEFGMPAQAWVTLIVGGLATVGVLVTWQQKNRADRRSEWWRRATWALERTFNEDVRQATLGWAMLAKLVESPLATKDDSDIVQVVAEHAALGDADLWEVIDGEGEPAYVGEGEDADIEVVEDADEVDEAADRPVSGAESSGAGSGDRQP
jgi:hypothetical protein